MKGNNNVNMTLAFMFPCTNVNFSPILSKICNLNGARANICQHKQDHFTQFFFPLMSFTRLCFYVITDCFSFNHQKAKTTASKYKAIKSIEEVSLVLNDLGAAPFVPSCRRLTALNVIDLE